MEYKYDSAKFAEVWRRVMPEDGRPPGSREKGHGAGPQRPVPSDGEAALETMIRQEAAGAAFYRMLAGRCRRSRFARSFAAMAAEEEGHLRRLQACYFILTGDTAAPAPGQPFAGPVLSALRTRYLGELAEAQAYQTAGRQTGDEKLAYLFDQLSADENRHAGILKEIIEKMME